jgi:outer membrane protein TolC
MAARRTFAPPLRLLALAAACALAASCTTVPWADVRPANDYVGPARPGDAASSAPAPSTPRAGSPDPARPAPAPPAGPAAEPSIPRAGSPDPARSAPPPPAPPAAPEAVSVTVTQAVLTALENNPALIVQRYAPRINQTFEDQQLAVFDPNVTFDAAHGRTRVLQPGFRGLASTMTQTDEVALGATQFFPTGTAVALDAATQWTHGSFAGDDFFASRVGLSVTQALLRGYGTAVNLAGVRQARLDTLASEYELRGFAEALIAQVEQAYWNYALTGRQIEIVEQSLALADEQFRETSERIRVGKLAPTERAAAEAEVALRRQDLIAAQTAREQARLLLLRLMNPRAAGFWSRDVAILTPPAETDATVDDVEQHVAVALRMRPDLNEARLRVSRGDLEIVRTKNGLLPRLDLFATLGKTGYADTFGRSVEGLDDRGYDLLVGVSAEYPPANRDARAQHRRATLTRDQSAEAVTNLAQLVQADVRGAYVDVVQSKAQVAASAVTRRLQEEKMRTEAAKFRVGKSTSILVAQAQRDLLASRIAEVQALVAHLQSLVEFYRLEGSLLERRGIACPGREPVAEPARFSDGIRRRAAQ